VLFQSCLNADTIAEDQDGLNNEGVEGYAEVDVSGVPCLILDYDTATIIRSFSGDTFGNPMNRMLLVHHANANTGIKYSDGLSRIHTLGQQDVVGQAGMIQLFWISDALDDGVFQWWEVYRAYNNHIKNVWASVPANPQIGQMFMCEDCTDCGSATYPIWWTGAHWKCGDGTIENGP